MYMRSIFTFAAIALTGCTLDFDSFRSPDGTSTGATTSSSGGSSSGGSNPSGGTGGTSGGTGGTSSGTGGTSSGTGGSPTTCPPLDTPSGGTCDTSICTGGCEAGSTCVIDCEENDNCDETTIVCPAGFNCQLVCSGKEACSGTTLVCPEGLACDMLCDGGQRVCEDAVLTCAQSSNGSCKMGCKFKGSCVDAVVNCGPGQCTTECPKSGMNKPTLKSSEASCLPEAC